MNRTVVPEGEIAELGPFTWTKQTIDFARHSEEDLWVLTHINGVKRSDIAVVGLTHFALKNYGGTPGKGFHGWKLVSGGPFDGAGAYSSLRDAIEGVTPYVIEYYTRIAAEKRAEANRILELIKDFQPKLILATPVEEHSVTASNWSPCG